MHPGKKDVMFGFVMTCVVTAFFAYATIRKPDILFAGFLVASSITALLLAYRVFAFSDDWYRAQERKEQLWYAKHPRLTVWLTVFGVGWTLWLIFDLVRPLFQ